MGSRVPVIDDRDATALAVELVGAGVIDAIYRALEAAYPNEGCGFVFEASTGELVHVPTQNQALALHQQDPERNPRNAADWFEPDMRPWFRAERSGQVPRLIYHSHPEADAYFSASDAEGALFAGEDGEMVERTPGVLHLVASVRKGAAAGAKLFRYVGAAGFAVVAEFDPSGALLAG